MAKSINTRAAHAAAGDLRKVIASFDDEPFMDEKVSARTQERRDRLAAAAPDIQQMLEHGLPEHMADRLARLDEDNR